MTDLIDADWDKLLPLIKETEALIVKKMSSSRIKARLLAEGARGTKAQTCASNLLEACEKYAFADAKVHIEALRELSNGSEKQ